MKNPFVHSSVHELLTKRSCEKQGMQYTEMKRMKTDGVDAHLYSLRVIREKERHDRKKYGRNLKNVFLTNSYLTV